MTDEEMLEKMRAMTPDTMSCDGFRHGCWNEICNLVDGYLYGEQTEARLAALKAKVEKL